MIQENFPRLSRIDHLLKAGDHSALQAFTLQEIPRGLLSEQCLDAARALRLPVAVIYLATLAVENLSKPAIFEQWLAVYRSLGSGVETAEIKALSTRHPLRVLIQQLLPGNPLALGKFRQCKGSAVAWIQALELAFDQGRFDLLLHMLRALGKKKLDVLDWLRIAKSMIVRQRAVKKGQVERRLGEAYLLIREQLRTSRAVIVEVRSTLSLCASDSFFLAREYKLSVQAAQLVTEPMDRARASYEIARAYCHLGDFRRALEWLDRLIPLTCEAATEMAPMLSSEFVVADAASALVDLQQALAKVGQRAFLVSGTLLGFAREGKILDHDKDLDVGVIGWEQQFDVAQAVVKSGHFHIDLGRLRADKAYHLQIRHVETGIPIDIFLYHREGEKFVTGVESNFGYVQKFAFSPFELKAVSFLGIDFFVPSNVDLNLAENFGNWRESDPDYISHLQSPSTVDVGGLVFQVVGRLRALEAIQAGKHERLSRVVSIMTEHNRREGGMSEETLSLLSAEVEKHRPAPAAGLRGGPYV
jgi:tetratricopeptide (TPR) repeat protein